VRYNPDTSREPPSGALPAANKPQVASRKKYRKQKRRTAINRYAFYIKTKKPDEARLMQASN
jgi:hypothetical protein